jgi:LmbE family N-acetylglucosaminyl deacetylase
MKFDKALYSIFTKTQEYFYKKHSLLHHVEHLEGPNVWVLSPHPDDDVIGCGGTLIKHVAMGHKVRIIYLCSGDKGIKDKNPKEVMNIRKSEAQNAALVMGLSESSLHFLNFEDEKLRIKIDKAAEEIRQLFNDFPPNLIYLPSFLDKHNDHFATNQIVKKLGLKNTILAAYEVWTPLIPNRIVDISNLINQKEKAIQAHVSQIKALQYDKAILGLNQYRAKMYTKKNFEYAEAFLVLKSQDYYTLIP